ncbi:MAG: nickel/cobalt transporter (NicO) family protein [Gaiellales bacterium]|nr:nickel/cobalt transporter (NicO) family protein [Gaiellales bacterium]
MRRLTALTLAALALVLALPSTAAAHPLGNFTINRYSLVELQRGEARVTFVLDIAEIPTFQALGAEPAQADADRYLSEHAPGWAQRLHLTVNGTARMLTPSSGGTATLRQGQGGLRTLRIELPLAASLPKQGVLSATYADDSFGDRLGWKEIVIRAGEGVVLTQSSAATRDASDMLRRYPSSLLSAPLDVRRASFDVRYGDGASVDVGASGSGATDTSVSLGGFTSLIEHRQMTIGFVLLALLIAMFWGAVHALSPGHGKSLVAAYLVGSRGTSRHAVALGIIVTITHTSGVFALGVVALQLSSVVTPEELYPWLSVTAGVMVVGVGAAILRRRLAARRGHDHHHHGHEHHHHHHHHQEAITPRSLLALGVSGGLVPCPSALVVMLGAVALGRTAFGLVLVVAFSVGLAATLTAVGLVALHAHRLLDRVPSSRPLFQWIPVASALMVTLLGVTLTVRALETF